MQELKLLGGSKRSKSRSKSRRRRGGSVLADASVPAGLLLLQQYLKKRTKGKKSMKKKSTVRKSMRRKSMRKRR